MRREQHLHDGMRMPDWMRLWVYAGAVLCFASGALWLLFEYFVRHDGPFGPEHHPLQHLWLVAHGGAGLLMLWVFGLIWLAHVRRGWPRRRNRNSGALVGSGLVLLALSGWGLYYLGDEDWRSMNSLFHWILGLLMVLALPLHIWLGRRSRQGLAAASQR